MRILYWSELFYPYIGGVEVLSAHLLRALREHDHELTVVTTHGALDLPDEDVWEGLPVHRIGFRDALTARDPARIGECVAAVRALKDSFRPDVVHLNVTDASAFFHLASSTAHPCPSLIAVRVAIPENGAGPDTLLRRLLTSAAWVTANSRAIHDDLLRVLPELADRSSVVYNALPDPGAPTEPPAGAAPIVLGLGRLVRDKGFDLAVEAFAQVRVRCPGARLALAGDGPERAALERQAAETGLDGAVEFRGWVAPEAVPSIIAESAVVVVPSRWREAFCLVALEASLLARPVVVTAVGGLPEVVADGETGLVVAKEDAASLAAALARLLDDPALARRLGTEGARRARRLFGFEAYVDAHEELYARVTA